MKKLTYRFITAIFIAVQVLNVPLSVWGNQAQAQAVSTTQTKAQQKQMANETTSQSKAKIASPSESSPAIKNTTTSTQKSVVNSSEDSAVTANSDSQPVSHQQTRNQKPEDVPDPPKSDIVLSDTFNILQGYDSYIHPTNLNEAVITQDEKNQKGGLWYQNPINLKKDFSMEMYMFLGNDLSGADGIAFVMQNDPRQLNAIGATGAGLGAYGKANEGNNYIKNGLALEFDTYYNSASGSTNDLDVSSATKKTGHIAIQKTQGFAEKHENLIEATTSDPLMNNKWRKVNLAWNAKAQTLNYSIAGYGSKNYHINNLNTLFNGTNVYWGFTGSTGSYSNNQAVAITQLPDQTDVKVTKSVKNITNHDLSYTAQTTYQKGDTIEYSIDYSYSNQNTQDLIDTKIKDALDSRTTYVPGTLKFNGKSVADSTWENNDIKLGKVKPGNDTKVTFQVKVSGNGLIKNTATAMSKYGNPVDSNETEIRNGDLTVTKIDGDTKQPLKGVVYSLYDVNGKLYKNNLTTNSQGQFDLHYLPAGTYYLQENQALPGYTKDQVKHKIVIEKDQKTPVKLTLKNYKPVKPKLTKTVDVKETTLGSDYTYTLKVSNPKDGGTWYNAVVTDALDSANLQHVANTTTLEGQPVADSQAWQAERLNLKVGDLKPGESKTIKFKVHVISVPNNKILNNTASAVGQDGLGQQVTPPDASVKVPVDYKTGELVSTKSVSDQSGNNINGHTVKVGDVIHFDIKVANRVTDSIVTNILVKDTLVKGFSYQTGSLTVDGKPASDSNFNGQNLSINIGNLTGNQERTVGFDVKITADADGSMKNIAVATGATPGTDVPATSTTPSTDNEANPEPSLTKDASVKDVNAGDEYTYTLTLKNADDAGIWHAASLKDQLPDEVSLVANSTQIDGKAVKDDGLWTGTNLNAQFGDMPAGATHTVTFKVKVTNLDVTKEKATEIINVATASGLDAQGKVVKPQDAQIIVLAKYNNGKLFSYKTVADQAGHNINGKVVKIGDILHYEINVINYYPTSIVRKVQVSDTLPAGLEYQAGTLKVTRTNDGDITSQTTGGFTNNVLDLNVGDIANKTTDWVTVKVAFDVKVTDTANGDIENIATATSENPGTSTTTPPTSNQTVAKPTLTKTVDTKMATLGDEYTYTLTAANEKGAATWLKAEMNDILPGSVELVPGSTKQDGNTIADKTVWANNNRKFHLALGDVKSGQAVQITFKVKVIAIPASHVISNTATAAGQDSNGKPLNPDDATANVPVDYKTGALSSIKTVTDKAGHNINGQEVKVGDRLHFDIQVKNPIKDSIVENVIIKDLLEEGFTYVNGSLTQTTKGQVTSLADSNVAGQQLTVNAGTLKGNESTTIGFDVTVNENASAGMKNVAIVDGTTPGKPTDPTTTPPTTNQAYPEPKLEKTASVQKTYLGDTFEYTLKVNNAADAAKWLKAELNDQLSTDLSYVANSTQIDGQAVADRKVWSVDQLHVNWAEMKSGESHTIKFKVKVTHVPDNGYIRNVVQATGTDDHGTVVAPDDAEVSVPVNYHDGQLTLKKAVQDQNKQSIDGQLVKVGQKLHYRLTVKNPKADSLIDNVILRDQLTAGLTYVKGTLKVDQKAQADNSFTGQDLNINLGQVKADEIIQIEFDAVVNTLADGQLPNQATVAGQQPSNQEEKATSNQTMNTTQPDPLLTKTASVNHAELGDTFTYTLDVRNQATGSIWHNASVQDTLDTQNLELVPNSTKLDGQIQTDTTTWQNNMLNVQLGDLNPGVSHSVTFQVKVKNIPDNKLIVNQATATGEDSNNQTVNPPLASVTVPVDYHAGKLVAKKQVMDAQGHDLNGQTVKVGDRLHYTITTTNPVADSLVTDVLVQDTLINGLTYVSGSLTQQIDQKPVTSLADSNINGQQIKVNAGQLAGQHSVTIAFDVTVNDQAGTNLKNVATVGGQTPGDPDGPGTEVTTDNHDQPQPSITKEANVVKTKVGDRFKYTLTVKNAKGAGQWLKAVVSDKLPDAVTYVPGTTTVDNQAQDDTVWQSNHLTIQVGTLKGGQSHQISFMVATTQVPKNGSIINLAQLTGQDDTGLQTSYQARADVFVNELPGQPSEPGKTPEQPSNPGKTPGPQQPLLPGTTERPVDTDKGESDINRFLPQTGAARASLAVVIGIILITSVLGYRAIQRKKRVN